MLGLFLACIAVAFAALQLAGDSGAPPVSDEPISIEGGCPEDEVLAYVGDGPMHGLEKVFGPLEAMQEPGPGTADMNNYDLEELRAAVDALAAVHVPPCLEGIHGDEVAVARFILELIEDTQDPDLNLFRKFVTVVRVARGLGPRFARLQMAYDRLGTRLGVDFEPLE